MQQQGGLPSRAPDWVSKTDITRYFRCPYAFWLLDQGEITFEESINEFQAELLLGGVTFQERVEATAVPIVLPPGGLAELFREEYTLFGLPLLENAELKIFGIPDGVETAAGALLPIEIKSHKNADRLDELELAFYWMLLEPYRTRRERDRRGVLLLRRDGRPERVDVSIPARRFDEVGELLDNVRSARTNGVRPRICGCAVCSGLRREEVLERAQAAKDLTLIFGIGETYARALENIGLKTWEELLACDTAAVAANMREKGYAVSARLVERWRRHAESWSRQVPVYFGGPHAFGESFIALDLEYDPGKLTWLIGVGVVVDFEVEYSALWADSAEEETENLRRLHELVYARPELPVITWAGRAADIPALKKALVRRSLKGLLEPLFERHLDLFLYSTNRLRLPTPGLGLKEVAEYFGVPRRSHIQDGLEAAMLYQQYQNAPTKKKLDLRMDLTEYNRDDVESLVEIARRIRAMPANPIQSVADAQVPIVRRKQPRERSVLVKAPNLGTQRKLSPKERSDAFYQRYSRYFRGKT